MPPPPPTKPVAREEVGGGARLLWLLSIAGAAVMIAACGPNESASENDDAASNGLDEGPDFFIVEHFRFYLTDFLLLQFCLRQKLESYQIFDFIKCVAFYGARER